MENFLINSDVLAAIDDYHEKSLNMQKYLFGGNPEGWTEEDLTEIIDDDLIRHVPIYDMLDRRYAAFSSLLEAVMRPDDDPKGNSDYFPSIELQPKDSIALFYLFRLCGSGINYVPKENKKPFGSHGFGNFWVVDLLREGVEKHDIWIEQLDNHVGPFTDNKGYLLPQFKFDGMTSGHLKHFIMNHAAELIDYIYEVVRDGTTIIEAVDACNDWLKMMGFKRQNFVLSATMADIAEYYPGFIDPNSMIYAGTNAKKCIRAIFTKTGRCSTVEFESQCIRFLSNRYGCTPYSAEDSRLCDVVRYFQEYQSKHHIAKNNGRVYKNTSVLKIMMDEQEYRTFADNL